MQSGLPAATEGAGEVRFAFGKNWRRFSRLVDEERIARAQEALARALPLERLDGLSFLDIGSGSGVSSLVARRLGARVHSFDYDLESVATTRLLRERFRPGDGEWTVERGSATDARYMESLERFDIVYSWGVLHHTGELWRGLDLAMARVAPGGFLFVALYNDQGWISRYWKGVKTLYSRGGVVRGAVIAAHAPYLLGGRLLVRSLTGRLRLERGMSLWHDMLDWLGGMPFEVASRERVQRYVAERGFTLRLQNGCGRRHGCNEFVFQREGAKVGGASTHLPHVNP